MTYAPENLPEDLSLRPQDMIDWKKRLGYYFGRVPQLYYCGEYGDKGDLPHYHAIVFCDKDGFEQILKSWTLGRISVDKCTAERCAYCTGYCTEKLDKPERTDGRHPEFHGASRKPPLGYRLLYEILEKMAIDKGFLFLFIVFFPNVSKFIANIWGQPDIFTANRNGIRWINMT